MFGSWPREDSRVPTVTARFLDLVVHTPVVSNDSCPWSIVHSLSAQRLVFSTCWSFLGVLSRLSLVSRAQFCRFWSVPGAGWRTQVASSRRRFRCPLRIRNALFGRSGRARGFAALVSALVFTFVASVYDAVVADVLGHAGCVLPSASATVQELRADVAGYGPLQISWAWHVDKSVLCSILSTVKFDDFVYWLVLLPAAPSLLDGITGFCVIDAAMLMLPLSEDWPVLLGVWPAPSFQPYVFAALHAALLLFVIQVVLLVSGRNILVSPWLLDLRLSLFSASPTALLRLSFWEGMIQSKEVVKESLFSGPSCSVSCISGRFLVQWSAGRFWDPRRCLRFGSSD